MMLPSYKTYAAAALVLFATACNVPGTDIPVDPPTPDPVRTGTPSAKPVAIIYGGPGVLTGPDDTLELAHTVAREAGFEDVEVTSPVKEELLARASVWIQPGGPNLGADRYMNANGMADQVREFVRKGGGYVGFCGGAFSAVNNLELIPGSAWGYGAPTKKLPITWEGKVRYLHYEHGPYIKLPANGGVEVIGTFSTGHVAAARAAYGQGRVFISGPHPEASGTWPPVADPDGTDHDLAIGMILWAARK